MKAAASATAELPAEARERVAELEGLVAEQQREIQLLREKLHYALHRQFGRRFLIVPKNELTFARPDARLVV